MSIKSVTCFLIICSVTPWIVLDRFSNLWSIRRVGIWITIEFIIFPEAWIFHIWKKWRWNNVEYIFSIFCRKFPKMFRHGKRAFRGWNLNFEYMNFLISIFQIEILPAPITAYRNIADKLSGIMVTKFPLYITSTKWRQKINRPSIGSGTITVWYSSTISFCFSGE